MNKTQLRCQQYKLDIHPVENHIVQWLQVTVEDVVQFVVYFMKIFAQNNSTPIFLQINAVDELREQIVPETFCIASKRSHVDFVVDVAYFDKVRRFGRRTPQ
jgi:hypothetical protein